MEKESKKFKYTAVDIDKNKTTGFMLAADETELRKLLMEINLYLVSCKAINEKPFATFTMSNRAKYAEIPSFAREFAIMIDAGIPIVDALETLKNQPRYKLFQKVLSSVHNDVRSGLLLSEAFAKHKKIFPELFINMTYIGEVSGTLDSVLNELAEYYERDYKIRQKASSALVYPIILSIMTLAVFVLLVVVIIPSFKRALSRMDIEIPPFTAAVLSVSDFFVSYWQYLLLGVLALIILIAVAMRFEKVKLVWDTLKAKLPIVSKITENLVASRFARGFGTLASSGVDIIKSLQIMGNLIGNRYYKRKYIAALKEIEEGRDISESFKKYKIFPPILIQMLSIGEKSGSLDSIINRTTAYFDGAVERSLTRMTALIEPLIICIMGAIVAAIILAVFSPILTIITTTLGA